MELPSLPDFSQLPQQWVAGGAVVAATLVVGGAVKLYKNSETKEVAKAVDEDQEAQRPEELARDQQDALITARKIKQDLKDYWSERHVTKVVGSPKKALVYSTVIKVISMFVALIFPFIGYGAFFGSVYLIDRGMWLRHEEYLNNLVRSITWLNAVVTFFQQLFAPTIPVPPAPAAAETTVTG